MKKNEIPTFKAVEKRMDHFLQLVMPVDRKEISRLNNVKGVYVFYEGEKPIYVGRTNNLGRRLAEHVRSGSSHYDANFAFKIAKTEWKVNYPNAKKQTREELQGKDEFGFGNAKVRVAKMKICYVPIDDPYEQYLFEFFAALHYKTEYNDFENH